MAVRYSNIRSNSNTQSVVSYTQSLCRLTFIVAAFLWLYIYNTRICYTPYMRYNRAGSFFFSLSFFFTFCFSIPLCAATSFSPASLPLFLHDIFVGAQRGLWHHFLSMCVLRVLHLAWFGKCVCVFVCVCCVLRATFFNTSLNATRISIWFFFIWFCSYFLSSQRPIYFCPIAFSHSFFSSVFFFILTNG